MAGYDSPWMRLGLRADGYPVLDPRSFRDVPADTVGTSHRDMQALSVDQIYEMEMDKLREMLRDKTVSSQNKMEVLGRLKQMESGDE